jgi:hypothetical protein
MRGCGALAAGDACSLGTAQGVRHGHACHIKRIRPIGACLMDAVGAEASWVMSCLARGGGSLRGVLYFISLKF